MKATKSLMLMFISLLVLTNSIILYALHKRNNEKEVSIDYIISSTSIQGHLGYYFPPMINSLKILDYLKIKEGSELLIENEYYKLTSASSKLISILHMPLVSNQQNILETYLIIYAFNEVLVNSESGRSYILENSGEFLSITENLLKYCGDINSSDFENNLREFRNLIQKYYIRNKV